MKRIGLVLALISLGACGGGSGGGNPLKPAVLTTETHSGSVAPSTGGGCNSSSHNFTARAGTMSVRLDATNAAAQDFAAQICTGGGATKTCALSLQRITVGQTLSATSEEGVAQTLSLLRRDCVTAGTQAATPLTYTVTLTYLK